MSLRVVPQHPFLLILRFIGRPADFLQMLAVSKEWRDRFDETDVDLWWTISVEYEISVSAPNQQRGLRSTTDHRKVFFRAYFKKQREMNERHELLVVQAKAILEGARDRPAKLEKLIEKFFPDQRYFNPDTHGKMMEDNTLLTLSCRYFQNKCIKLMVDRFGANVNISDVGGFTPLILCAYHGNFAGVLFLLGHNVDLLSAGRLRSGPRLIAEHWAAIQGHFAIFKYLHALRRRLHLMAKKSEVSQFVNADSAAESVQFQPAGVLLVPGSSSECELPVISDSSLSFHFTDGEVLDCVVSMEDSNWTSHSTLSSGSTTSIANFDTHHSTVAQASQPSPSLFGTVIRSVPSGAESSDVLPLYMHKEYWSGRLNTVGQLSSQASTSVCTSSCSGGSQSNVSGAPKALHKSITPLRDFSRSEGLAGSSAIVWSNPFLSQSFSSPPHHLQPVPSPKAVLSPGSSSSFAFSAPFVDNTNSTSTLLAPAPNITNSSTAADVGANALADSSAVVTVPSPTAEAHFCLCRRGFEGQMIGCDSTECPVEWYHYECVGLTARPAGRWLCALCTAQSANTHTKSCTNGALEDPYCICGHEGVGQMVSCDNSQCLVEWYHFACVGLAEEPSGRWECPACIGGKFHQPALPLETVLCPTVTAFGSSRTTSTARSSGNKSKAKRWPKKDGIAVSPVRRRHSSVQHVVSPQVGPFPALPVKAGRIQEAGVGKSGGSDDASAVATKKRRKYVTTVQI